MVLWEGLGQHLKALASSTTAEVVVVSPFIKRLALQRILAVLPNDVPVLCVTRWRADELACGASDLDVFIDLVARGNARVLLVKQLHAKYFRFDSNVVVGSCNITGAALAFKDPSNLELAATFQADKRTASFEAYMAAVGVPATRAMYEAMQRIVGALPRPVASTGANEAGAPDEPAAPLSDRPPSAEWQAWLPVCRAPASLFDAYSGRLDDLTLATRASALADLRQLEVPPGLTRPQFEAYVAGTILSAPLIARLAEFASTPRRFGEMRDLLRVLASAAAATNDWQTIMRWLLHFAPDRFDMRVANYSEIFSAKW